LLTIRTWKSDTITAIESHDSFANRYPGIEEGFAVDLYKILERTFSSQNNESILQSLRKGVIAPAIELARKVCLHQLLSGLDRNANNIEDASCNKYLDT
jgi:hypothetical protein